MTVVAPASQLPSPSVPTASRPSYAYAHWYMLAAFGVVFLGFWPTFYQPLTGGTTLRTVHGITSTLWYVALIVQPWLVTNGYVRWHKRVAIGVIALLPVLCVTALMTTRIMLAKSALPPPVRPLIAYLDITITALFVTAFILGLLNRRVPAAHKRYMASTSLMGFLPSLTRYISGTFAINPLVAIGYSFYIVDIILVALIVVDWRNGERRRWAYPIALGTHVAVQLLMMPVSMSAWWVAFCGWFAGAPLGG